jgi:carbon-monoxide dehydrogenase medium subunit
MRRGAEGIELRAPETMAGLLALLGEGWRPWAGGTDLMVLRESGRLERGRFAALWRIPELQGVSELDGWLRIGAAAAYSEIRASAVVRREFALLAEAARLTGGPAIQNAGTLGGNIGNASPAADSAPPLLVYDAELELRSAGGARRVDYARFHTGYKTTDLRPGELIAAIWLPRGRSGWLQEFRKVAARRAQAISKVSFAAAALVAEGRIAGIRIAYGAVAPTPLRCFAAEQALRGARLDALPEIPDETAPIDDLRSTARYRRVLARRLLLAFLEKLKGN